MTDLDFGPHRRCALCGELHPEPRCLEYNDRWYCGITCKLKAKRREDDALRNPHLHLRPANDHGEGR